jgi:hypothetical protein
MYLRILLRIPLLSDGALYWAINSRGGNGIPSLLNVSQMKLVYATTWRIISHVYSI